MTRKEDNVIHSIRQAIRESDVQIHDSAENAEMYRNSLRRLHDEAQQSHQQKLKSFRKITHKSERMVFINIIFLSGIATILTTLSELSNILFVLHSIFQSILSIIFALWCYTPDDIVQGISTSAINKVVDEKPTEIAWLEELLAKGYANWLNEIDKVHESKVRYLRYSQYLFISAIVTGLIGGIIPVLLYIS